MTTIITSLEDSNVAALLQPKITRNLKFYRNLETAEDVLDYLWQNDSRIDFVILDKVDVDLNDLYSSAQRRPETRFVLIGKVGRNPDFSTPNVTFLDVPTHLYEMISSDFSL